VKLEGGEISRTFSTRDEARIALLGYLDAHRTAHLSPCLRARATTLAEALGRYAVEEMPEKLSGKREESTLAVLLREEPELCAWPLDAIATSDLSDLIKRFKARKRTGSTIIRYLALISHCYTVAGAKWGFDRLSNPVVRGLRCRENAGRERRLEPGEEARLLHAATQYEQDQKCC
jgi:hypothetical protein